MTTRVLALLAAFGMPLALRAADAPPPPTVPPEYATMLAEHRGSWRTEGWFEEGGKRIPSTATWNCVAAVDGPGNVCTWHHAWTDKPPDSALEIMGYDARNRVLSITRITDQGIIRPPAQVIVKGNSMLGEWDYTENGQPAHGRNEIVVQSPGHWEQRMTVTVGGKVVREMRMTHRREQNAGS